MVALSRTAQLLSGLWLLVAPSLGNPLDMPGSVNLIEKRQSNGTCHFNIGLNTSDIADQPYVKWVRNVRLPSGTTYRYVFSPPSESDKPWLLFLHGFPESSFEWVHQIVHFTQLGYGVIAPDLLGYGGTDNPSDLRAYSYKNMADELRQLLECEGVDKVAAIGHDLGVLLMSRILAYHSDLISAVAFLGTGYLPPQVTPDAAGIGAVTKQAEAVYGYTMYGYWQWLNRDDTAALADQHLESLVTLTFTSNTSDAVEHFAQSGPGAWLEQNRTTTQVYRSRRSLDQWKRIFAAQGGLEGPFKWYKSWLRGINDPDRAALLEMSGAILQPTIIVLAEQDPVGPPAMQLNSTVPFAPNLRIRSVDSGHFIQVEKPVEVNVHLERFLRDVFTPSQRGPLVAVTVADCIPPAP